jgi:hypothetical protein
MALAIVSVHKDNILRIKVALLVMLDVLIVKKKIAAFANQESTSNPKNSVAGNVSNVV